MLPYTINWMKTFNDDNDFRMKTMKKVILLPKKYWLKKYNDGINFKIKMLEKASVLGGRGGRETNEKNRMKVKMKLVNMCHVRMHGLMHDGRLRACPSCLLGLLYIHR